MHPALRFTTADVEALPDPLDDRRYELIDGELWLAKQPHWEHQLTGVTLGAALLDWSLQSGLGVPNAAPGLIFSPEDAVAPDVVWISHERLNRSADETYMIRRVRHVDSTWSSV